MELQKFRQIVPRKCLPNNEFKVPKEFSISTPPTTNPPTAGVIKCVFCVETFFVSEAQNCTSCHEGASLQGLGDQIPWISLGLELAPRMPVTNLKVYLFIYLFMIPYYTCIHM